MGSAEPMTLTIVQLGNPQLRRVAKPVDQIASPQIQTLIDHLIATATATQGVGIAAPQVGVSKQLLIVASRPNLRYPQAPVMEPMAMINPQIVGRSDQVEKGWEGCLSVPGLRGYVPRHRTIEVTYCDRWGNAQQTLLTEFVARIFQHEYDHLEGKVFVDRVERIDDLMTEQEYQSRVIEAL